MDLVEDNANLDFRHWYYKRKFDLIEEIIRNSTNIRVVCDVGAGKATLTKGLALNFPSIKFIAVDINYSSQWIQNKELPNLEFALRPKRADMYLMNDVIEHIANPTLFLNEVIEIAESKTIFLVTVPAFMHLWSGHDVFLNHYRRYSRHSLSTELASVDLSIDKMTYLYWSIYPFVLIFRKLKIQKTESQLKSRPLVDIILNVFMQVEKKLPFGFLPGVSIWCVARKD